MSSTTATARRALEAPVVEPVEADVFGLDAVATLTFVTAQRRRQDAAAADEVRAVTHWADLHRVGPDELGAVDPEVRQSVQRRVYAGADCRESAGIPGVLGVEGELRLAGEGAFRVDEFAVAELAAALGMSEPAGRAYVGQAVELRDRLPHCWDRVMRLELPAWKGRQIAEQTIPLTADAAAWVDTHLAPFAHKLSLGRVLKAVDAAVLRFDPAEAARRAEAAAEKRGVWVEDRIDGTTAITAVTNTPDAVAFDTALSSVAATLADLGDVDPLPVRRAKAVGVLADPQFALTLLTGDHATDPDARSGPSFAERLGSTPVAGGPVVHVHLHIDAVTGVVQADGGSPVARVAGVTTPGPRPVEAVERWLRGLRPDAVVKVTPVVDLTAHLSVDAYEVPSRIAAQLEHRDLTCRFPWCNRTGGRRSLDKDHIDPYRFEDLDDPGGHSTGRPPPGQTATSNLAQLCRFHHRLKTRGGWDYRLTHDTVFTWTSPLGRRYNVDETGTRPLQ
jgi:hypothetical protein